MTAWTAVDEPLAPGGKRVLKSDRHRVLVGRLHDGALFAIDNACPHEGYPLAKGDLAGCVLTCRWHNFRFDVRDGKAVLGDEAVRTYPTREVDGRVEVDLTDPPVETQVATHTAALEDAVRDGRHGQAAREVARLVQLGVSGRDLLVGLARLDARYTEYGTSHVLPLAADLITRLPAGVTDRADLEHTVLLVQQLVDLTVRSVLRRPARPVPAPLAAVDVLAALADRVEAEDTDAAEALARQAAVEVPPERLFAALVDLCARHFLGFGHGLIFAQKLRELGGLADADLVGALALRITNQTREDLLPEWSSWRAWVATLDVDALSAIPEAMHGPDDLLDALTAGSPAEAHAAAARALGQGRRRDLRDALTLAAVERVRRFDPAHDADPSVQNGWLDVTHTLTFADAIGAAGPVDHPSIVRLMLQLVHFANHARALDRAAVGSPAPRAGDLTAALRAGDPDHAEAVAAASSTHEVCEAVIAAALSDDHPEPIVVAHLVKTALAAARLAAALPPAWEDRPRRGLARLAAARIEQRFTRRRVNDAVRFVIDGKVPRSLT